MKCRILTEHADVNAQPCAGAYKKEVQFGGHKVTLWFLDFGSMEAFRAFVKTYPSVSVSHESRKWHLNILLHQA